MAGDKSNGRISLGECLDQLFNRECLFPFEQLGGLREGKFGGLVCPAADQSRRGTGNIVIKGAAGTGKSTLALQIAVEAARRNKHVNSAYISLEESPQQLFAKAKMFGWEGWLTPLTERPEIWKGETPSRDNLPKDLDAILKRGSFVCPYGYAEKNDGQHQTCNAERRKNGCRYSCFPCKNERKCCLVSKEDKGKGPECGGSCGLQFGNHVLLPGLDARVFEPSDEYEKHDHLFRVRLAQLEDLLHAAKELNSAAASEGKGEYGGRRLDVVCIDSLNVLGQGHLTRDHLSALFDLFRQYGVIGVFVYEQIETGHITGRSDLSLKDIEFLADTVIDLTGSEFQGYWVRHFHISKSRHQQQVLGRHPFKILEAPEFTDEDKKSGPCRHLVTSQSVCTEPTDKEIRMSRFGIRVFPSIHTVIRSSSGAQGAGEGGDAKVFFQEKNLNDIAGEVLKRPYPVLGTISGPLVAGKSILAFNFLLQGLAEGQNGILITLGESCVFNTGNAIVGDDSANVSRYICVVDELRTKLLKALGDDDRDAFDHSLFVDILTKAGVTARKREGKDVPSIFEADILKKVDDILTCLDKIDLSSVPKEKCVSDLLWLVLSRHRMVNNLLKDRRKSNETEGHSAPQNEAVEAIKKYREALLVSEGSLLQAITETIPECCGPAMGIGFELAKLCAKVDGNVGAGPKELAGRFAALFPRLIQAKNALDREYLLKNGTFVNLLDGKRSDLNPLEENLCRLLGYLVEHHKVKYAVWSCRKRNDGGGFGDRLLGNYVVEMALQPGTLLPEELGTFVRLVYAAFTVSGDGDKAEGKDQEARGRRKNWPRRAVLLNAGRIGVSYPFLNKPTTGPELFLTGLSHLFHCRDTDFLITVPTGGVPASEEIAKQAASLADSVLECSHLNVFGDRYVTVTGPGMIERDVRHASTHEDVPGVLRRSAKTFSIDMNALAGLVGFSTGDIRRPGVLLQLFEEGMLHQKYNHQVKRLVQFAMGESTSIDGSSLRESPRVQIDTFDSEEAGAFHRSLDLLQNSPLSNTVVRTVDEFAIRTHPQAGEEETDKDKTHGSVYYRNMILFLCDKDTFDAAENGKQSLSMLQDSLEAVRLCLQLTAGLIALYALTKSKEVQRQDKLKKAICDIQSATAEWLVALAETGSTGHVNNCLREYIEKKIRENQAKRKVRLAKNKSRKSTDHTTTPVVCIITQKSMEERQTKLAILLGNFHAEAASILKAVDEYPRNEVARQATVAEAKSLVGILARLSAKTIEKNARQDLGRAIAGVLFAALGGPSPTSSDDSQELINKLRKLYAEQSLAFWSRFSELVGGDTTFLYDTRARETLACLAMDSILCLCGLHQGRWDLASLTNGDANVNKLNGMASGGSLGKLFAHFRNVLPRAKPLLERISGEESDAGGAQIGHHHGLHPDAKVVFQNGKKFILLAWYSHVRELLELLDQAKIECSDVDKRTSVANLRVLSLPAGGFKGDWYLQVPAGSVSESLGRNVCNELLNPVEDFNRFVAGVGLPCWPGKGSTFDELRWSSKDLFEKLKRYSELDVDKLIKAWPGSEVPLQVLLVFHHYAHRRSDLIGYESIRDELFAIMEDIRLEGRRSGGGGLSAKQHAEFVIKLLERLK